MAHRPATISSTQPAYLVSSHSQSIESTAPECRVEQNLWAGFPYRYTGNLGSQHLELCCCPSELQVDRLRHIPHSCPFDLNERCSECQS